MKHAREEERGALRWERFIYGAFLIIVPSSLGGIYWFVPPHSWITWLEILILTLAAVAMSASTTVVRLYFRVKRLEEKFHKNKTKGVDNG